MNKKTMEVLEFNKIIERLKEFAVSDLAKNMIDELMPMYDINIVKRHMRETTEARSIVDRSHSVPLNTLNGAKAIIDKIKKGIILKADELEIIAYLLSDTAKLKRFMKDKESIAPNISQYALSMFEGEDLKDDIQRCIINGRVDDRASSKLLKLRKKL